MNRSATATKPQETLLVDDSTPSQTALEPRPTAQPLARQDDVTLMFERFAKDPAIDVDKLERLMSMVIENQKRQAEMEFNAALSRAAKQIKAAVTDDYNPQTKSWFASYEALDGAARPHYTEHGLSLTFKTERCDIPEYITVVCLAKHQAGHTERYAIDMPADGKGAKGGDVMTKTHATGSAVTYGMRYLLKMIFNIPVKDKADDDGNQAGRAEDRKIPQAPKGFEDWWTDLQVIAADGIDALDKAWNDTRRGELKQFVLDHYKDTWASLKKKAAGR
jgi:hypothetical protein